MKKIILSLAFASLLISCKEETKEKVKAKKVLDSSKVGEKAKAIIAKGAKKVEEGAKKVQEATKK